MRDFVMGRTVLQLVPACKKGLERDSVPFKPPGIIQKKYHKKAWPV
jgi:hypothetical protein